MKKAWAVEVKIEYTYDYDKFKLVGINRKIDKAHVERLAEAILFRNLLHLFPLIVNKNWEVMDGQHRLTATEYIRIAKELHLPIYYIMDVNIGMDDMRLLNSNKINWKNQDYINYYAGKGETQYQAVLEFQKSWPLVSLSAVITLLSSKKRNLKEMKEGKLLIDRVRHANKVMGYIHTLRDKMDSQIPLWKNGDFIDAMSAVVLTGKYNHAIMMKSTRNSPDTWDRQISKSSYIFELTQTYNHNLSVTEKVNFIKLCSGI